ncbi:MAG: folate-binding protein [Pseudomonadota bacterium]
MSVAGAEAIDFLEKLVTCDVTNMPEGGARFGALLSPQGKILYDFFLLRTADEFLIDIEASLAPEFAKRLMFYRLRAKVEIETIACETVIACWHGAKPDGTMVFEDNRHPDMGYRVYNQALSDVTEADYAVRRVNLGVPEGGMDFEYGDAYPHETLMDQFTGVDFRKGCYVGQEVVSRMQHRGTAKKRVIKVNSDADLPDTGTPILADGKPAGRLGTVSGQNGLALLRLDRAAKAENLTAGDIPVRGEIQDWVDFDWPEKG